MDQWSHRSLNTWQSPSWAVWAAYLEVVRQSLATGSMTGKWRSQPHSTESYTASPRTGICLEHLLSTVDVGVGIAVDLIPTPGKVLKHDPYPGRGAGGEGETLRVYKEKVQWPGRGGAVGGRSFVPKTYRFYPRLPLPQLLTEVGLAAEPTTDGERRQELFG